MIELDVIYYGDGELEWEWFEMYVLNNEWIYCLSELDYCLECGVIEMLWDFYEFVCECGVV